MVDSIIRFSIRNKLIVVLFSLAIIGVGLFSLSQIPLGAVPDITNNQVQVITVSRNLATQDVEQFITYPVELEMANLPGVLEIRSISKFGLSVVTIVFDEDLGTYLPRQLIAEKIKKAQESIPVGFGTPEMGPITTGLGEIYQYILDVKPGYEGKYSTTELRTIQDWIVKRYLSGIPGVVEVNTWGGFLKQYEVAVDPTLLNAAGVTITEVFDALEASNDVTGGAYIEKASQSYFIRGEGQIKSLEELGNVVIGNRDGIPILIRQVGEVRFGTAVRFGAITANGQGEKVMGQVMMLKGANSSQVISAVKDRVHEVQDLLPEGVFINPFLERTELIDKTTATVAENLILGALIVIFVLVLLLGNFRSGMIVASVIPLSLLFGITLMNYFGVSANLMSLGAIDFGIIIDGAVIIVEYTVLQITSRSTSLVALNNAEKTAETNEITANSASTMMRSAIFGQIIILIVFIPILSLSGIEGKMFKPMALSFSFALIGAMILCLTYVPAMSAFFLKPKKAKVKEGGVSNSIINAVQRVYTPTISFALRFKALVIGIAAAMLIVSIVLFMRLGGEFIPTLDEGDYVVQPILKPGTSLSETVDISTKLERILLQNFPEVSQVITRIGAAEVPTDPMSMEMTDVIIRLKPKSEWVSEASKDELADKMKAAMLVLPGIGFEFTQPIEMRFNELITGVRADVAIKIFGENLDTLFNLGNRIKTLVQNVEGAADVSVEQIAGLPQMSVRYDRNKLASYGLMVKDVNRVIRMAFAGEAAGVVFEGEKRFDLVVRTGVKNRKDMQDLSNLFVALPGGGQVPLREVASITYEAGPAQISRDDTRRRIVVSINVRNRDMESLVEEMQLIISQGLDLPAGYHITYGGQFENLQNAKERLMVAVPVALLLIFIMLYFTFGAVSEALLVFSAIPLAAIGGVIALAVRDMPFSISAGVGFIALFGIAVLNGIVLIEFFNELKHKGVDDIRERVMTGTKMRLRPVLLTASAAALGFFPMAFSGSAGAEVQRPLATVVIGGLVSATFLTLVVLPVLYTLLETGFFKWPGKKATMLLVLVSSSLAVNAQNAPSALTLDKAIEMALENNNGINAAQTTLQGVEKLEKTAFDPGPTHIYYGYDQNNIAPNGFPLRVLGVQQQIAWPGLYTASKKALLNQTDIAASQVDIAKRQLSKDVAILYLGMAQSKEKLEHWEVLDSLYAAMNQVVIRRAEVGDATKLELIQSKSKASEVHAALAQSQLEVAHYRERLKGILQSEDSIVLPSRALSHTDVLAKNTSIEASQDDPKYQELVKKEASSLSLKKVEESRLAPTFQAQYFKGFGQGENAANFDGYQFGIGIPLLGLSQVRRVQASKLYAEAAGEQLDNYERRREAEWAGLQANRLKFEEMVAYYQTEGLKMAEELISVANRSYTAGEIDLYQLLLNFETARQIRLSYIDQLHQLKLAEVNIAFFLID
ncbi:CusA/CzcA family heavy metal efflux RND transporter [uncultured Imperialibacter sp.]|uniref:CusA/CzcA family heavy metal efflux RND transporter n=1 Tax=uncultured Imperialibacter sp. TaxID=1672639 RepID=UPI0030DC6399|tara:strand:- start:105341 stop:109693 length:4353 start_codon:yes stop_codon:yes gene_type:complete